MLIKMLGKYKAMAKKLTLIVIHKIRTIQKTTMTINKTITTMDPPYVIAQSHPVATSNGVTPVPRKTSQNHSSNSPGTTSGRSQGYSLTDCRSSTLKYLSYKGCRRVKEKIYPVGIGAEVFVLLY